MSARLALPAALVALLAYAAFAAGAARRPGEAWFEILAAVLALAAAAVAAAARDRAGAPAGRALAGVALLAAFAAWCGLSLLWSIDPDGSWQEFNRALSYALLAGAAVLLAISVPRAIERFATLWLLAACVVALYALTGKVAPGLLDDTAQLARLRAPLEYWNALGLLCALATPVAIRICADSERRAWQRLAALEALALLEVVIGLTYSRGAVAAFGVGALVLIAAPGTRVRRVVAVGLGTAGAVAPLAYAFSSRALTTDGAALGARIHDGRILAGICIAAGVALWFAGRYELRRAETNRLGVGIAVVVGALAVGLVLLQHGSGDGGGAAAQSDPVRLLSTNSSHRTVWWNEAIGAWSDRPLAGWGAGSFARVHLRYRHNALPVTQAHSVPLQLLAETGLVGLLLAYGGLLALLAAAIARIRSLPWGRERDLATALVAAAVAWLVHAFYDWDFTIPAVTAPVIVMLGLVAGLAGPREDARAAAGEARAGGAPAPVLAAPPAAAARFALLGLAALVTAIAVTSAALPALSASKADGAAARAAAGGRAALQDGAAEADLAARLDPLAGRPLFVAAAIAQARGRLLEARDDLLEAVRRDPDDPEAWSRLVLLAIRIADRSGAYRAAARFSALDPRNPGLRVLLDRTLAGLAPPSDSASATGTPLLTGTAAPTPDGG